jgi:DNA-directed RNA polymerase subunit RPC12/RpoP
MSANVKLACPTCGNQITDTRIITPYDDFDEYLGFRCSGCNKTFSDREIEGMIDSSTASPSPDQTAPR